VRVGGTPVTRVSARTRTGDEVEVVLPPPPPPRPDIVAQEIPLSVVYEDDDLLVVDKPPGLVVHPAAGHHDGTLVNALLWRSKEWGGGDATRPGLVHRLDKDTSGLLMVARTDAAHAGLARALKARSLTKEYLAVVYGRTPVQKGKIDLRVLRDPLDRKRMTTSRTEGRESTTLYERLAESEGEKAGISLLRCTLLTGRTHQIRVHLKSQHLPIVGDATYGAARWKALGDPVLAAACRDFPRQALHAWRLSLSHPVTGEPLRLEAPVPADVAALLAAAGLGTPH